MHLDIDPKEKCAHLLERSQEALGAAAGTDVEVAGSFTTGFRVVYENKDFTVSTAGSTDLFGIRMIADGRPGFATTNSSVAGDVKRAAGEASAVARVSPKSEWQKIAKKSTSGPAAYTARIDKALLDFTPADAVRHLEMLVGEVRKDTRVSIDRAEFSVDISCSTIVNSNGVEYASARSTAGFFVMGMAKTPEEVTSFDYDGYTVTHASELENEISRSAALFRESVTGSLGAAAGNSYNGKVLLHPRAASDLISGFLAANANARMHQDQMSAFKDKLGQAVASGALFLFEDPLCEELPEMGWTPFDREGVPTARHHIVEDGVLAFLGHNCFTAARGSTTPTGNATGSPRALPGIGFHNLGLEFRAGRGVDVVDQAEIERRLGTGLVVVRFSGNSDPVSGRFSGVAKNSYRIENGRKAGAVKEVMVSGNLFELVKQVAASTVPERLMDGGTAPYVLVDGIGVTAG